MRKIIAKYLRRIARLLDPEYDSVAMSRAIDLVKAAEDSYKNASGEFKRHKVYSQLRKEFSYIEAHSISMLIELAVRDVK